MKDVWTRKEVAEILSISMTAVGKLLRSGDLKGTKDEKGIWEITEKDLRKFRKLTDEELNPSRFIMNDNISGY